MEFSRWQDHSVCGELYAQHPEKAQEYDKIFFGSMGRPTLYREYSAYCDECPVRQLCLEDAIVHNERSGIWGGVNTRHRDRLAVEVRIRLFDRAVREKWLDRSRPGLTEEDLDLADSILRQMNLEKQDQELPPDKPILEFQRIEQATLHISTSYTLRLVV